MQKRQADSWDPTPARRVMYDDKMCEDAKEIPGPGTYAPKIMTKDKETGITFSTSPFLVPGSAAAQAAPPLPDRDAGSLDAYRVKVASQMPGPASYTVKLSDRGKGGSTFGLPPSLRKGRVVPDAHDMSRMVKHLRDLPAPDAYSPRNPMAKNAGFRMFPPSGIAAPVDKDMVPGPGMYDLGSGLSSGRSTILRGGGKVKSDLDIEMDRARDLPGPGTYGHQTTMRSKGSPRFSKSSGNSLIEAVQVEARVRCAPHAPSTRHPPFRRLKGPLESRHASCAEKAGA